MTSTDKPAAKNPLAPFRLEAVVVRAEPITEHGQRLEVALQSTPEVELSPECWPRLELVLLHPERHLPLVTGHRLQVLVSPAVIELRPEPVLAGGEARGPAAPGGTSGSAAASPARELHL